MKFDKLKPEHRTVLKDIENSIPTEWKEQAVKQEKLAPVAKEVIDLALKDPDVSEEQKAEFRAILASGYLDTTIDVENKLVVSLIDAYVEKEILKAVIKKKLPPLKVKQDFTKVYKRFTNLKEQYESRRTS